MPAPDPDAIELGDGWPKRASLLVSMFMARNPKARMARAEAIVRNLQCRGWSCHWCGDPVPLFKRADAKFCCEGCRKRNARRWREWRGPR